MDKIRIGVIGYGNIGKIHAAYLSKGEVDGAMLTAVANRGEAARALARKELLPEVQIFDSGEALITSRVVDAVLIATPHKDHPELAELAFKNGIHVLCEKPAGVTVKQVRAMNKAWEQTGGSVITAGNQTAENQTAGDQATGLVFGMVYNQRTNPVYAKLRELIKSGKYGELKRVNWIVTDWYRTQAYYESGGWRSSWRSEAGGVLMNQCPHNLDLLQWICGMPEKVRAFCHEGKWHEIEVEDDVTAYLEFPNGATGVFVTSTGDLPGTNRLEITLDGAQFRTDGKILEIFELSKPEREICFTSEEGFYREPETSCWRAVETEPAKPQYQALTQSFVDKIRFGRPQLAEGEEGIRAVELINAMLLSSWLSKEVTIPFDEALYEEEYQKKVHGT